MGYDTEEHALRRWLEVKEDFPLHHDGKEITMMKKGMRIQTEISRKFTDERMQEYAKGAEASVEQVETADGYYKCAIFRPKSVPIPEPPAAEKAGEPDSKKQRT